jgi:hypothetical protein
MDNGADVRLIDAQPKCGGSDDHVDAGSDSGARDQVTAREALDRPQALIGRSGSGYDGNSAETRRTEATCPGVRMIDPGCVDQQRTRQVMNCLEQQALTVRLVAAPLEPVRRFRSHGNGGDHLNWPWPTEEPD